MRCVSVGTLLTLWLVRAELLALCAWRILVRTFGGDEARQAERTRWYGLDSRPPKTGRAAECPHRVRCRTTRRFTHERGLGAALGTSRFVLGSSTSSRPTTMASSGSVCTHGRLPDRIECARPGRPRLSCLFSSRSTRHPDPARFHRFSLAARSRFEYFPFAPRPTSRTAARPTRVGSTRVRVSRIT